MLDHDDDMSERGCQTLTESDRDTGMCNCSSLKSIIQMQNLIKCSQFVIYTLRGIWGFMYGHVCGTGCTSPSSLEMFHV